METKNQIILNIGSGTRPIEGTINLDIPFMEAKTHITGNPIHPEIYADAHHLPFRDSMFNEVLCHQTLEHLNNPHGALSETNRVLRQRGKIVIEVPDAKKVKKERKEHLYSWTRRTLSNLITATGFRKFVFVEPRNNVLRHIQIEAVKK